MTVDYLIKGHGAECAVIADLASMGIPAYLSSYGLRYDVVADLGDRLIRIQVKSTEKLKVRYGWKEYVFRINNDYEDSDFELIALVANGIIGYLPNINIPGNSLRVKPPGHPKKRRNTKNIDELLFKEALEKLWQVRNAKNL